MWLRESWQSTHLFQLDFPSDEDGCRVVLLVDSAVAATFHLGHTGQEYWGSLVLPPRPWIIWQLHWWPVFHCLFWCTGTQTHTHIQTPGRAHRDAVTPVFPLFFSIYHSVAESATIGLCAVWVTVFTLAGGGQTHQCVLAHFSGRLCVCLCMCVCSTVS